MKYFLIFCLFFGLFFFAETSECPEDFDIQFGDPIYEDDDGNKYTEYSALFFIMAAQAIIAAAAFRKLEKNLIKEG